MTVDEPGWVQTRLGVEVIASRTPEGVELSDLVELALRRNPRRAHLLVSTVLGKHLPVDPRRVHAHGLALGRLVAEVTGDQNVLVLGNAETATGLGHSVADALDATYVHSTRRPRPDLPIAEAFTEAHSHAPGHLVQPLDPTLLLDARVVVLVDDELTTGATALETVAALERLSPGRRYVIACLLDMRGDADRERVAESGVPVEVVSLAAGHVVLPDGLAQRAADLIAAAEAHLPVASDGAGLAGRQVSDATEIVEVPWPAGVPLGGRHGFTAEHRAALESALPDVAKHLAHLVDGRVLVLGTEELMYAPTRIGAALAEACPDAEVLVSSTTRSPVFALDEPGYPIRTALAFPAHDGTDGARFAYNVAAGKFDAVLLVVDPPADSAALRAPGGLLEQLRAVSPRVVVVRLPELPEPLRGPAFGSYTADEVGWLLKDLSHVELEAPTARREAAVQSGRAHYAESLPIEYQPGPEYLELFEASLARSAERVALAVGTVAESILAHRGRDVVLVSLARAGTPIGILLRRWLARTGPPPPHYAVSIIRGRGIDPIALTWLAAHHDPSTVVFVDGWTGKGAITTELQAALKAHAAAGGAVFDPSLAVVADPGSAAPLVGTRQDLLIPSACLNSTVSGLVSRTVLRADLIGPGDFHGAKFHAHLAEFDSSHRFLDAITARFDDIAPEPMPLQPVTFAGRTVVEEICRDEGVADPNFVKPGVGETTRVLLRRVPDKVLFAPDAIEEDVAHIRLLAAERGVPTAVRPGLPYQCVGLIRSVHGEM